MLFDDKRRALHRALAGALLGMAGGGLAAWAAGSLIAGSPSALALAFLNCGFPRGLEGWGLPCPSLSTPCSGRRWGWPPYPSPGTAPPWWGGRWPTSP